MREKEVKLLKVCMGADDRELARYAKTKLKDKGFLIEENVVSKGRRLSDHDLYELYHSNDPFLSMKSRELVVLYYKNYVYSLIDSYFHAYMMDYKEDLYQCGAVGLLKSLVHYDGTYTIMTYSRMYIIHEMTGYVYYLKNIPSTHYAKVRRLVVNAEEKLEKEGKLPTDEDIVKETGLSMKTVKRERQLLNRSGMVYLDSYTSDSWDAYTNTYEIDSMVEQIVFNRIKFDQVVEILSKLPDKQKDIVYLKICKGKTFYEIAKELGMDKDRVRSKYYHILSNVRKKIN